MTQPGGRNWAQLWTAHLATEAVVAYVDGELSVTAHERATRHLASCPLCTAEVAAQRQARAAVRSASTPALPPSLLAALHAIPHSVELPPSPDGLAIGEDGQFVVAQRPLDRSTAAEPVPAGLAPTARPSTGPALGVAPLGLSAPLGSGDRLGSSGLSAPSRLPAARPVRRVAQGAGVVVSGLVLGALALTVPEPAADRPQLPGSPGPAAESGGSPVSGVPARFDFQRPDAARPDSARPDSARQDATQQDAIQRDSAQRDGPVAGESLPQR